LGEIWTKEKIIVLGLCGKPIIRSLPNDQMNCPFIFVLSIHIIAHEDIWTNFSRMNFIQYVSTGINSILMVPNPIHIKIRKFPKIPNFVCITKTQNVNSRFFSYKEGTSMSFIENKS
jgi:hypothetical protein